MTFSRRIRVAAALLRVALVVVLAVMFGTFQACAAKDRSPDEALGSQPTQQPAQQPSQEPAPETHAGELCAGGETVLFGFDLAGSSRAMCVSYSEQGDYLVYRFGSRDKIELEFPKDKSQSWSKFTYSYYLRPGGAANEGLDLSYLLFENGGFEYRVYEEHSASDAATRVGIIVTDKATGRETDIEGESATVKGSLVDLRTNPKIMVETE